MGAHDFRVQIRILLRIHPIHGRAQNRNRPTARFDRLPMSRGINPGGETACDDDVVANQYAY